MRRTGCFFSVSAAGWRPGIEDAARSFRQRTEERLLHEGELYDGGEKTLADTLSACGVDENTLLSLVVAASTGAAAVKPANAPGTVTSADMDTNGLRKEQATASDADVDVALAG